jgi:drug/metabolite transporter (DMT)-like permease
MLDTAYVIALTLIAAATVAYAQYVFKKAVPKFRFNFSGIISLAKNRMVVAGIVTYMVGLVFYLFALGSEQLSFVYPAFSSTFIFVIIISHFKLKERLGYARLAGIVLIIAGIALVSLGL